MSANNFMFDTRETQFILKEWLDMPKLLSYPKYKEYYGVEDLDAIIDTAYKLAKNKIGPINEDADKIGIRYTDGKVVTPGSFKTAFQALNDTGLGAQIADREAEGALPYSVSMTVFEMLSGACAAFPAFWGLTTGAMSVLQKYGNEEMKRKFLPKLASGEWSGTMNLTEPGAGSDVGLSTTKAFPTNEPGIYKIKGNKMFITAGEHDLVSNIIHLVLARVEGAREGVAGLSLFIVPKYWVNDDGRIGEFNDVICTGIEEKLGLHGSPTTSLAFGEDNGCRGYLIGEAPDASGKGHGIEQMFTMMNEERAMTGMMGLSCASQAYYQAREYAKQRIQGNKTTDPKGPKVRIIEHEDVRRMLLMQKAVTEAARALITKTYYFMDLSHDSTNDEEREYAEGMFQISNPMCKAYATDIAWPMTGLAIQTYGGYGFISEYPVEQLARDCKVYSIWEGTNYIQSIDLVGRKFTMKKGFVFNKWLEEIKQFIVNNKDNGEFDSEFEILASALDEFTAMIDKLHDYQKSGLVQHTPLYATRILHASSMLYCAALIMDQALLANRKLKELGEDDYDAKFYKGKVASACFYVKNVLPDLTSLCRQLQIGDTSAIELNEESF